MIKQKRSNGATFHFQALTGGACRTSRARKSVMPALGTGVLMLLFALASTRHIWAKKEIGCDKFAYHKLFLRGNRECVRGDGATQYRVNNGAF